MNRFQFTLKEFFKHKKALKQVYAHAGKSCRTVLNITPNTLDAAGVKVLVLDFDGVLAGHAELGPHKDVLDWLKGLIQNWPHPIFIFSNNPFKAREDFFRTHFPTIQFIKNIARKPFPDGLLLIEAQTKVPASKILMVDDRLLTGILCAQIAGTQTLLITKPYLNFKANFV